MRSLRVGLDGRSGFRRDDQRRACETIVHRTQHLRRCRAVEDGQRRTGRLGDDLGGERRAAHAREHDAVDAARAEIVAQCDDLRDERSRVRDGVDPAEPHGGLGRGIRAPQVAVAGGDT